MIIDCHCHAGKGDELTAPWTTSAPIKQHLERAEAAGIDKTVVFPVHSLNFERANAEVAEIVNKHQDRLFGFARVHAINDRGRIGKLVETAVKDYGFRGIKVHGGEAFPGREVLDAAKHFKIPVLLDTANDTQCVDMIAEAYPEVDLIVAHLGSFRNIWHVLLRTAEQLATYPNVYADTSGIRFYDGLVNAINKAGAEKVLFGSDGPMLHPGIELQKVKHLYLSPEDEAKVLGNNFAKIIGEKL
ncbi:amidohydrolase family protein [Radiobacillus sp. PE A8.2]|uniref:amidohydrolase family protein n=1 Tax=Radiobacillus sp. PE A8.2 TaxID=3380349 RepID=UPI00388F69C7